jgi:hypothetical protein
LIQHRRPAQRRSGRAAAMNQRAIFSCSVKGINAQHTIFRNPDKTSARRYLQVYTVKKGQSFLMIP